jgi:superfamily II DNA/RNA helicase
MPNAIMKIAQKFMKDHEVFRVAKGSLTISSTDQIYFEVSHGDKFESFCEEEFIPRGGDQKELTYYLILKEKKKDGPKSMVLSANYNDKDKISNILRKKLAEEKLDLEKIS